VVIPARNEAEMLSVTLPDVLAQDYPGPAEVFLVDDCSTDATAATAEEAAGGGRLRLHVISGGERPPGWVGKTWALQQGFAAAVAGSPADFVLFTDADIRHPEHSLRLLVATALDERRDMVSLMAKLRTANTWERLIVPAFVYFFSQLYPFRLVARDRSRCAAAAGGCILVRRRALEMAGGLAAISTAVIDDVAMGTALKRSGASIWLGYATDVESIRPYPRLADLWDMVARSAYTQLRYSPTALAATVVGLAVVYEGWLIVVVAGLISADPFLIGAGGAAWALLTASYLPMLRYYRLSPLRSLTLPVAAAVYGAMTVDSARRHLRGAGAEWKGRTYAAGDLSG
jgi:hopene-associated glycosyltransferase HpnB